MKAKLALRTLLGGLLVIVAACGIITEPKPLLDEFTWEALEDPNGIVESADVAPFLGDLALGGQLKTPTLCYTLKSTMEINGNTIDLQVAATSTNSSNCAQTQGGFRYTGIIRNLSVGTYTVKVTHSLAGQPDQVFTKTVKL